MEEEAWEKKNKVADGFSGEKLGVLLVSLEKTSSGMNATGYGLFRILAIPLHFLIDILDICLEWIMKATCCLLRYNRAFMFGIVNLSMSYLCCEMPQKSCQYLHLILFFSSSQRAHG